MTKNDELSPPRKALGKGLSALLPSRPPADAPKAAESPAPEVHGERVQRVAIELIDANPYQPRRVFDLDRLAELALSIRAEGIIQPIVVQRNGTRYTLIVGERRWRAARMAGLQEIPCLVRHIPPERVLEVTLIENIQREDLNPIETAQAFDRMVSELQLSHEEIAKRTGKDRSTITNLLRLLRLPTDVQQLVGERRLSMGHARALLGLAGEEQQRRLAEKIVAQGLSVRQVERTVKRLTEPREPGEVEEIKQDPNVTAAILEMEQALGTRVRIVDKGDDRGRIEIEYYSAEDLERIYTAIVKS
jgi:ParB family chromosome partitioning protein